MNPYWADVEPEPEQGVGGLWDSIVGWFQGSEDAVMRQYEQYKAKLYTAIGNLLGMRETILDMQDRANSLVTRAQQVGNPVAISAARNLKTQIDQAYQEQLDTERKVQDANRQISAIDAGTSQTSGSGIGVAPLIPIAAIAGAVAVVVAAIAAITIHTQRVNYLKKTLTDLESKLLTPGEYQAAITGVGGSPFDFLSQFGTLGKLALAGGIVYVGYQIYQGSKRGRRR